MSSELELSAVNGNASCQPNTVIFHTAADVEEQQGASSGNLSVPEHGDDEAPLHKQPEGVRSGLRGVRSELRYTQYMSAMRAAWPDLPDVTISYSGLGVQAQVPVRTERVPNLASAASDLVSKPLKWAFRAGNSSDKPTTVEFNALQGATGIVRPGEMTLVLAPPGHGKSMLLKALAGRLGHEVKNLRGEIRWNDQTADELKAGDREQLAKLTAFVDQGDVHYPMLTTRETLEFALAQSNADVSDTNNAEFQKLQADKVNLILELLGLVECADTPVGGPLLRGISGGQKKRVTLGEMMITQARALFLDEISTGLDSSATLDIVLATRRWCRALNGSAMFALLQPAPEVFDAFDRIILMREGQIVFSGSKVELLHHFSHMLRVEPNPTIDLADWLTEFLTDPPAVWLRDLKQKRALAGRSSFRSHREGTSFRLEDGELQSAAALPAETQPQAQLEAPKLQGKSGAPVKRLGGAPPADPSGFPLTTVKLVAAYRNSAVFRDLEQSCAALAAGADVRMKARIAAPSALTKRQFHSTFSWSTWHHIRVNLWRQQLFYTRSPQFVGPRIMSAIVMGLVGGSVFYQLGVGTNDFLPRLGVALFSMIFLSFGNSAELPLASEFKMVVSKQVNAGYYSPAHYVSSVVLSHFPLAFVETVIFTLFLYFMSGFTTDAARYFIFMLVALLQNLAMSGMFRAVAWATDNADIALNMAAPTTAFAMLFGGFLIVRDKIPNYAEWLYWLSPFSWGLRTDAINEFHASRYGPVGDIYLDSFTIQKDDAWKGAGLGYLAALYVLLSLLGVVALRSSMHRALTTGTRRTDEAEEVSAEAEGEVRVQVAAEYASSNQNSNAAGEAIPFQRLGLSWQDLRYTVQVDGEDEHGKPVKKDRVLLSGINGFARAGQLTALMGSSGAGKTTLMDVLAGRKTSGKVEGKILLDGHPQTFPTFARLNGYCEQEDVHLGTDTVRDAIEFSAALRLPASVTAAERAAFVDQILADLELTQLQNRLIGDENIVGLSPGELKRVTIGVELAANPSILFLDEPTSALDSRAALAVVRVIRKIAERGRAVICTVHQPSAQLLSMFDRMLLLASGGRTVFFGEIGEEANELVEYFMGAEIPKGSFRPTIGLSQNPASWMLEVIGAGTGVDKSRIPDYAEIFKQSALHKLNQDQLAILSKPKGQVPTFETPYARSFTVQFSQLLLRLARVYFRDIQYNNLRFCLLAFLGVIIGLLFRDIDDSDEFGVISKMSSVFVTAGFLGFLMGSMAMPVVLRMRNVFYREQASHAYSPIWYANALALVELPYLALAVMVYCIPIYFLIHFQYSAGHFFQYYAVMLLVGAYTSYMGQMVASLTPNLQVANILFSMIMTFHFTFGGVFVQKAKLPIGWQFMYYLSPLAKALVSVSVKQFECEGPDCPTLFSVQYGGAMTRWEFVKQYLASGSGWDVYYIAYLVLTVVIARIFATWVILKVSHYSR